MDFYFFTSFVNMIWQIFTILFVLYRFTSFFSMMYNFLLFVGKLFKGVVYVKDQVSLYIARRRGYSYLSDEEIHGLPSSRHRQPSFFTKMYTKVTDWIFGRNTRTHIPLYETRTSYIHNFDRMESEMPLNRTPPSSPRSSHADTEFENHMNNNMMNSHDFERNRSMVGSSIYPPPPPQRMYQSSMNTSSIYTQTPNINTQTEQQKPFNVEDSNLLLNSQFLTKMLQPFHFNKSDQESMIEENEKDKGNDNDVENKEYNQENDDDEYSKEFEEELLKNPYI